MAGKDRIVYNRLIPQDEGSAKLIGNMKTSKISASWLDESYESLVSQIFPGLSQDSQPEFPDQFYWPDISHYCSVSYQLSHLISFTLENIRSTWLTRPLWVYSLHPFPRLRLTSNVRQVYLSSAMLKSPVPKLHIPADSARFALLPSYCRVYAISWQSVSLRKSYFSASGRQNKTFQSNLIVQLGVKRFYVMAHWARRKVPTTHFQFDSAAKNAIDCMGIMRPHIIYHIYKCCTSKFISSWIRNNQARFGFSFIPLGCPPPGYNAFIPPAKGGHPPRESNCWRRTSNNASKLLSRGCTFLFVQYGL